ncbi:metallophosphoesterase [Massilia glaciei]|uniref:Metallophosphoesterase n=1 Tax=Massilia glaciei TaxID=1524097 RepID=A0A2U2HLT7_9BURK|nr:metallophosphoesterase [Massilia glaciei]PWF48467.1 metallophosphoesterase [Massilia glaciei]
MRILVLSDLHLELWREHAPRIDPAASRPDVVVLAGDISTGAKAVAWAASNFSGLPVVYVHGNHEAYGHKLEDAHAGTAAACAAAGNVHFLNADELIVGGVRFLGATLWTERLFGADTRPAAMRAAEAVMNDYRRIRLAANGYRKLRAADTAQFHSAQLSWLKDKLAMPFAGPTVVVTHMAPSMLSVQHEYVNELTSAAYASRLGALVSQANLWLHGHMHNSSDYLIGQCRVVCNPCGYMTRGGGTENARFDRNLIVEV